jgi:hypothetical protein
MFMDECQTLAIKKVMPTADSPLQPGEAYSGITGVLIAEFMASYCGAGNLPILYLIKSCQILDKKNLRLISHPRFLEIG